MEITQLARAFRYNSVDLPDPGAQYKPEAVRELYSATYPEIVNAAIEGPEEKDGKLVYTFRRAVGTKGGAPEGSAQVGRLALRQEGGFWNAYYAQTGTMAGAFLLGSIDLQFVQSQERKDAFVALMREAVGDLIEKATGIRPIWGGLERAPEHERAGHG